ncbi:dual specificity protein phosphatase family protein [Dehalogenimonas etheniformans]|nr:dual specificity protein phosphatase family protein [Dehalogenimonas etheniformans]
MRMQETKYTPVTNSQITQLGLWDCHEPVADFTAPTLNQIRKIVAFIAKSLEATRPVGVSCGAGFGRTGTILACCLVSRDWEPQSAIDHVRSLRPGSIEPKSQESAVREYFRELRNM